MVKVIHFISSLKRGGRERQLATIYQYNKKAEHSIRILYLNDNANSLADEHQILKHDLLKINPRNLPNRLLCLIRIIRTEKPGAIFAWGNLEVFLLFLVKPFAAFTLINGSIRHGIVKFNIHHISRLLLLHLSTHIVANSHKGLQANFLKKGHVLYNGIHEKFFQPITHQPLYKEKIQLISVANLVPYKDYFSVIKALKRIKTKGYQFKYTIIGDGSLRKKIESFIEANGLCDDIHLVGSKTNVEKYLQRSDVLIHSSQGEGCPNAVLEAMASGLAIIAAKVGGIPEIIDSSFSVQFAYKDIDELEQAIEQIIIDKDSLSNMKLNAQQKAINNFSASAMINNYYNIIGSIIP